MIRMLIFILSVIFVAGALTWLASFDGGMKVEAFGAKVYFLHAGMVVGLAIVGLVLLVFFTSWFKDLTALPGKLKARERESRRARGITALTRGLEAVAVGDAADAQHHARLARRNLDDLALTRLLTAQAAQLAGDDATAGENFTAMLDAPETEFLGLRGLYLKAMREDEKTAARGFAERAFKLRPNADWAFDSVFDLCLDRGAWGEARETLSIAQKNKVIGADKATRAEVALLAADADAALASGDGATALDEAEAALKLKPGFAPAAVIAARRHNEAGKPGRASKILEQAFSADPHPTLVKAHDDLYAEQPLEKRAARMKTLADRRPTAREAKLIYARRHTMLGDYGDAIALLEPLLMEQATAREAAAMAEAVAGEHGADAAKIWLEKAAAAPRDPSPGADGEFHFTREGWARLIREYMEHERLAPPPLENAPRGLSLDELKQLAPPPDTRPQDNLNGETSVPSDEENTDAKDPSGDQNDAEVDVTAGGGDNEGTKPEQSDKAATGAPGARKDQSSNATQNDAPASEAAQSNPSDQNDGDQDPVSEKTG
ncbi:MAG: heme biosynthesis HemY N-terminal domain-containing protein [Pseudomonadota bacterium]